MLNGTLTRPGVVCERWEGKVNTMSAAALILETPYCLDASIVTSSSDERLRELVHELRQPLSSIEAIAYYVEMTLPAGQLEAQQYMSQVQQLIAATNAILERTACATREGCARAATADIK